MLERINYNHMPLKKIFIATMVFSLVLSTIPWQAMAQEELAPLSLPVPTKLENNTPIVLEPSPEPVDLGPNQSETKESDDESILDISAPVDQQPEELLAEPDNLVLDEPVDVPYIDRDEKKPAGEQLNVEIDSNTGALIYSYPIAVAPGRNGLQPDLRLTYNNQNSDNFNQFGMGWSINIPYIERDGKRGVNNLYSRNDFNSSLSGELRPIDLTDTTHGLYGSRVENGEFFKYEFLAADNSWKVTDKQGVIYIFGPANSSRQYDPSDTSKVYKWMLEEVRDTNDNYISYEYYQDGNEIYPYKVKYTGHDTTDGIFEVEFLREARNDEMQSFKTGFEVNTDYRIYEIQAKVNGSWVRKYELDYINGDNSRQSLLNTITQNGNDGVNVITLPSDDFNYTDSNPGWTEDPNFNAPYLYSPWFITGMHNFLDANGDSLSDDIELRQYPSGHDEPYIHLDTTISNGNGWGSTENWEFPTSTENNLSFSATRFADVNGDALIDIIISDYNRGIKDVYVNNGVDWELDNSYNFPEYFNFNSSGNSIDAGVRLVDLNGDGLVDVVKSIGGCGSLCTGAWLNNGHGWTQTTDFQAPVGFAASSYIFLVGQDIGVRLVDVNGDGLVDILRSIAVLGQDQHREVYINNGHGWDLDGSYYIPVLFKYVGGFSIISELVDINQDGLIDIVNITSSGSPLEKEVYINNGHGWDLSTSHQLPDIDNIHIFDGNFAMVDVNGDGFMDIIQNRDAEDYYGDDVKKVFINNGKKELLETINTSQGSLIDMNYKSSNSYRDTQGNLLNQNLPYRLDTVEQIQISDNYNEDIITNYSYADGDLYYNMAYEKRNAGFGEVTKVNGNQKTITYFHQGNDSNSSQGENNDTYYKIGKPYRSEIYDNNTDQLLKQSITKWEENLNEPPESQAKSSLIDTNIVSLWPMNGQAATIEKQDNIVGGPDLSERNNPTSVMGDDFDPDGAYNFNRYYERYLKAGDNDIFDLNYDFTIDALIKFNSTPQQNYIAPIVSKDRTDRPDFLQYIIGYRDDTSGAGNRGIYVQMTNIGLWDWEPNLGEWYYLSFVHDRSAGTVEVFIDGVSQGIKNGFGVGDSDSYIGDFYVGAHRGTNYNNYLYWNDDIDEIRISDKVRTPEEIANYSHIISNERKFVYDTQRSSSDLTDTTKSIATQKIYDLTNGNLDTEHSLGEVNIDLGTGEITSQVSGDEKDTDYIYAQNETKHILSAPSDKIISDVVDTKNQKLYYDNLAYGEVEKVNLTKEEYQEEDVEINRNFNNYGLVYEQSDPKFATTTITYDDENLYPKSTEDPLGYITLTEYNPINGQIASSTDPNGLVTNNTYDALGRLKEVKISDPNNPSQLITKQEITYYDSGYPRYKETKDYFTVSNYTTSREYYDGLDRVVQKKIQTDNASEWSTVDISYDEEGRVARQSLPYYTSSISYTSPDTNQPAKTYTYDAIDRVLTETTPVGVTTYQYDGFNTIIIDANGHRKDLLKDAYGNLIQVVEENEYTTFTDFQFEVDVDTLALWHMNGSLGSLAKKDNAEGTSDYDLAENNIESAGGFNGGDNGAYDFEKDNSAYLSVPDYTELDLDTDFTIEAWVKFESAAQDDELRTIVSKDGGDLSRQYLFGYRNDASGLGYSGLYFSMSSDGSKSVINGSALWAWEPNLNEWHYVVASYHRLDGAIEVFADGESLGLSYNFPNSVYDDDNIFRIGANAGGGYWDGLIDEVRISNTAHELEDISGYYNGFNKVVTEVNSNFYTTTYDYTLTNKLEKITDSQGNIRNFHYDELDNLDWQDMVHLSSVVNPKKIQYTHDKNGNVLTETSFKGDAISYVYDDLNRVLYEKLSGVNQISYTYDQGDYGKGQLTYADYGSNNHKAYTYDIFGRVAYSTTTIENENFTMGFEYNLNGDPETITYPNGWQVIYHYNSVGQVDEVQLDKGQGAVTLVDNIEYNASGQMTHLERANGIDTSYTYDPNQNYRLTDMETTDGVDMLQDLSYTYDDVGNITRIDDNSDTDLAKVVYYDYDDLNRLASSTVNYLGHPADNYSRQYEYDEVGNMTYNSELGTMNYTNNNPHQLSGYGSRTFVYDDAGNMTRNGGITKFSWDWRNRLKNTYDIASENNTYYKYDHNNQRFLKYTEDLVFIPPDPEDPPFPGIMGMGLETLDGGGGTYELRRVKEDKYVDGYFEKNLGDHTRTHILLNSTKMATAKDTNDPYFILSDHLNSSTIITDTSGNIAEISDYEPFGVEGYSDVTQDVGDDYTFTGQEYDEETDIQYFGARYMDNEVGRFVSIDPVLVNIDSINKVLSDPQSLNSYAYSRNNPVVLVDKDGNFWQVFTAAIGAVGGAIWGAGDAYNMVKYTFKGDIDTASYYSSRYLDKMTVGALTGYTAGVLTEPIAQVYAPNAYNAINSEAAVFTENMTARTISVNSKSNVRFTQRTMNSNFSSQPGVPKSFQNRSIDAVANDIRSNNISVGDVPINYVERDGYRLIDNTRSAAALQRAGVNPSQWNWQPITDTNRINQINDRLMNNNLSQYGTTLVEY